MLSFSLLSVLVTELNYLAESVTSAIQSKYEHIFLESSPSSSSQHDVYEIVPLFTSRNVIGKQQIFFFLSETANLVLSVCNGKDIPILFVTSLNY